MKKWLKFLMYWITSGLIVALVSPVSGCFSLVGNININGGGASTGEKIVLGALDVVTLPVQIVVFGPFVVAECIDANTGERGRIKRETQAHQEAVETYKERLSKDRDCFLVDPDFSCPTNKAAMEALDGWLWHNKIPAEKIRPFAEKVLASPGLLRNLRGLWAQAELSNDDRRKAFHAAVNLYLAEEGEEAFELVWFLVDREDSEIPDEELKFLLENKVGANERLKKGFQRVLKRREERRVEKKRRQEAEKKAKEVELARQKAFAERNRKLMEIQEKERLRHIERLKPFIASLEKPDGSFLRAPLIWHRDKYVETAWARRLQQRKEPIPVENLRRLAEAVLQTGGRMPNYTDELLRRSEFTAEDLRLYYGWIIRSLRHGLARDELGVVLAVLANPNVPEDVVRATYTEPKLVALRYTYFAHRHNGTVSIEEMRRVLDRENETRSDKKVSPEKKTKLLQKEIKKFLPKDCPSDWRKWLP